MTNALGGTLSKLTRKKGRRKMVTTGAITSRKLARVEPFAEVLYWRIYMASDNYGTMSADPWDVWQQAAPGRKGADEESIGSALDELVSVGLLERWSEADGTAWVHVLGHDGHQQGAWIARRGARRSPVPPSQRSDGEYQAAPDPFGDATPACVGTDPAPDAGSVRSPAAACSPTTTPTPTSKAKAEEATPTTSEAYVPIGAVRSARSGSVGVADPEAEHDQRHELHTRPDTPLTEIRASQQRIRDELAKMLVNPTDADTMAHQIASTKRRQAIGQPPKVYDIGAWERAVRVLVRQVTEEGRRVEKDAMGLLVRMVPSYEIEGSDRPMLVREIAPQSQQRREETPAEIMARFEREAAEREGVAS